MENPDAGEKGWRIFCAVELPLQLRERIVDHISELRNSVPEARATWNRVENLHLTLKFLGEAPAGLVDQILSAAGKAADRLNPFEITVGGCGTFPPKGLPRVLWIGIDDTGAGLARLYRGIEEELSDVGFPRERRPFHAHVTVARVRATDDSARRLAARHTDLGFVPESLRVDSLAVIRSILRPEGSLYTPLAQAKLGAIP